MYLEMSCPTFLGGCVPIPVLRCTHDEVVTGTVFSSQKGSVGSMCIGLVVLGEDFLISLAGNVGNMSATLRAGANTGIPPTQFFCVGDYRHCISY